jgi:cytochrome c553
VRFFLAAVMAAMLAIATTTDRVVCIDGCTDDAQHDSPSTATPSVCGLCHGWNGPLTITVGRPAPLPVEARAIVASRELPAHLSTVDHPPKLA